MKNFIEIGQKIFQFFMSKNSDWRGMEIHFVFPDGRMKDRATTEIARELSFWPGEPEPPVWEKKKIVETDFKICDISYKFIVREENGTGEI